MKSTLNEYFFNILLKTIQKHLIPITWKIYFLKPSFLLKINVQSYSNAKMSRSIKLKYSKPHSFFGDISLSYMKSSICAGNMPNLSKEKEIINYEYLENAHNKPTKVFRQTSAFWICTYSKFFKYLLLLLST